MKKCDILMARSLRSLAGGFVWGSTGISSQKEHYYNYSDIVIFWELVKHYCWISLILKTNITLFQIAIIYSFNKIKKEKSSIIVLSCSESSGDESEKAMPKKDKEELRKCLQNSDEEESSKRNSPQKPKKLVKKRKTSSHTNVDQDKSSEEMEKPKDCIKKDSPKKILIQGDDFKRLQKKAKKLGASSLDYSKRKNNKYMVEYDGKKIRFGSVNTEDFIIHKDPDRREKYLTKAKKITNKDGVLTYQLPSYPNYWSVKRLN